MNTRHTIPCLAIALSLALFLPLRSSVGAEESGLGFLRVGSSYRIISVREGSTETVKILAPAGGQWFRVEASSLRPDKLAYEKWINFANIVSVTEIKEPPKKEPERKEPGQ